MRASLFLLVCSALFWVAEGDRNLNHIAAMIRGYNHTNYTREAYVDAVDPEFAQGPGRCGEKFFCAARDILHQHSNVSQQIEDMVIVRNLDNFHIRRRINCTQALMNVTRTTMEYKFPVFLDEIAKCLECRSFKPATTSCSE